jgi:hypothetical protein
MWQFFLKMVISGIRNLFLHIFQTVSLPLRQNVHTKEKLLQNFRLFWIFQKCVSGLAGLYNLVDWRLADWLILKISGLAFSGINKISG